MISVVVETVTLIHDHDHGPLADAVAPTLAALQRQTARDFEILLVLDRGVGEGTAAELRRRFPHVRLVRDAAPSYFAEKNAGVAAASGEIVALLDGDCIPDDDWLASLVAPLAAGADVVTGKTRYGGDSLTARTFSVPAFGNVLDVEGSANGIMLNNAAIRRELALRHPLDARIRRNGGCFLLFHQLRAAGARMLFEPRAVVTHELDAGGLGFVRKHYDRGVDMVTAYRCDDGHVLRGTRLFRRLGPIALAGITARRVVSDWTRLVRHRRQLGLPALALPYYAAVVTVTRSIELCGGMRAIVSRRRSDAA